ncbi:Putative protein of unknown function [Podospora comata]|uniref:Uncharacterized protein n=1 Tax=Podospora comata TaxID=48703 RepID=A0ABY6RWG2_PODCO|nr:Putative protein of unknown function [Podospora comata]
MFPTKPYHAPYVTSYNHLHITIHTHYPTIDHKHDTTTPTQPLPHNHSHTTTPTQPLPHVPALLHIEPNTTTTNTSRYHDTPFSILNRFSPQNNLIIRCRPPFFSRNIENQSLPTHLTYFAFAFPRNGLCYVYPQSRKFHSLLMHTHTHTHTRKGMFCYLEGVLLLFI